MPSAYQLHLAKWSGCTRCPLHKTRCKVVLCRGTLPCDVLFLGEAPGKSEDKLGYPFAGPAGCLLDQIVKSAFGYRCWSAYGLPRPEGDAEELTIAFTNLVACIPLDQDGTKTGEPLPEDVKACSGRLQEIVKIADPKLLVCVGQCAAHYTEPGKKASVKFHRDIQRLEIVHPAYILRSNIAQQGFQMRKCVVQLRNAVEELYRASAS